MSSLQGFSQLRGFFSEKIGTGEAGDVALRFIATNFACTQRYDQCVNSKENPEELKTCAVYQMMITDNNKASDFKGASKSGDIHPGFVDLIRIIGGHHGIMEKGAGTGNKDAVIGITPDKNELLKKAILKEIASPAKDPFLPLFDNSVVTSEKINTINDIVTRISANAGGVLVKDPKINYGSNQINKYNALVEKINPSKYKVATIDDKSLAIANALGSMYVAGKDITNANIGSFKAFREFVGTNPSHESIAFLETFINTITDEGAVIEIKTAFAFDDKSSFDKLRLNLKTTQVEEGKVPVFYTIIPYLPVGTRVWKSYTETVDIKDNTDYLRREYLDHYHAVATAGAEKDFDKTKFEINETKFFNAMIKTLGKQYSTEVGKSTFAPSDLDSLINVNALPGTAMIYKMKDGKLQKVNKDGKLEPVDDPKNITNIGLAENDENIGNFMARCILTNDKSGLRICMDYLEDKSFFQTGDKKIEDVDPHLAKQVLRKFMFGKFKNTGTIESYENWESRMTKLKDSTGDDKLDPLIYKAIMENDNLKKYLKSLVGLVSSNPAILGDSGAGSSGASVPTSKELELLQKYGLIFERDLYRGKRDASVNGSRMLLNGVYSNQNLYSVPPNYFPLTAIRTMTGGQKMIGGGVGGHSNTGKIFNELGKIVRVLETENNVELNRTDKEEIDKLYGALVNNEKRYAKLLTTLKTLGEVKRAYEMSGSQHVVLNVGNLLKNTTVLTQLNQHINEVRNCTNDVIKNMQNCGAGLMQTYKEFADQVFKPVSSIVSDSNLDMLN